MSISLMKAVWQSTATKDNKRLIMLALADQCNDQGYCWPSMQTIANKANLSRRHTRTLVHELVDEGEIKIIYRKDGDRNKSNMYIINPGYIGKDVPKGGEAPFLTPEEISFLWVGKDDSPEPLIEPPLEPPIKPTRSLSEKDIAVSSLAGEFELLTRLKRPKPTTDRDIKTAAVRWWVPLWDMYKEAGNDLGRAKHSMQLAVKHMRKDKLTISAPQSIYNNFVAVNAENIPIDYEAEADKRAAEAKARLERAKNGTDI